MKKKNILLTLPKDGLSKKKKFSCMAKLFNKTIISIHLLLFTTDIQEYQLCYNL